MAETPAEVVGATTLAPAPTTSPKPPPTGTPTATGEKPLPLPTHIEQVEPAPTPLPLTPTAGPTPARSSFDLEKLIVDVFAPQPGEKVVVMSDLPHAGWADHATWAKRRQMAQEWHAAFERLGLELGFSVYPLLTYPATGAHSGPLPEQGEMEGQPVRFEELMAGANIVVALTEFSATGPMIAFTQKFPRLRVASLPGVEKGMEQTALAADYAAVARRSHALRDRLDRAEGVWVEFSTGHQMYFDLRNRQAEADDGQLHVDKEGPRIINLPSGEAFIVPYEGEVADQPSRTEGTMPLLQGDELVLVGVQENRIVQVLGDGPGAAWMRGYVALDQARRNIAELGLGCNDKAVVSGSPLEDEKVAGMHWGLGLSEHLGGVTGVADFSDPAHAVHLDFVYPKGGRIEIASLVLAYEDGTREEIIQDGQYTLFDKAGRPPL